HVQHREIRADEGAHQAGEGDRRHQEGADPGPLPGALQHRRKAVAARARQAHLGQRQGQGQHQAEGAQFGDHEAAPVLAAATGVEAAEPSPFHSPDFLSPSTTSLGMYFSSCLASTLLATNTPEALNSPWATTPWPSRNRSGSSPRKVAGTAVALSAMAKRTSPLASLITLPGWTRPPRRTVWPAGTCWARASLGT